MHNLAAMLRGIFVKIIETRVFPSPASQLLWRLPHDFLDQRIRGNASLCYFNYRQSGERIGRALIGLDFPSPYERDALLMTIPSQGEGYRLCEAVDDATRKRLAGF